MEIVTRSIEQFEEEIKKILPKPKNRRSWKYMYGRPPGSRYLNIKLGSWRTEPFRFRNKSKDHLFAKPRKFAEMTWQDFLNYFENLDITIKCRDDYPLGENAVEVLRKIRARAKLGRLIRNQK